MKEWSSHCCLWNLSDWHSVLTVPRLAAHGRRSWFVWLILGAHWCSGEPDIVLTCLGFAHGQHRPQSLGKVFCLVHKEDAPKYCHLHSEGFWWETFLEFHVTCLKASEKNSAKRFVSAYLEIGCESLADQSFSACDCPYSGWGWVSGVPAPGQCSTVQKACCT